MAVKFKKIYVDLRHAETQVSEVITKRDLVSSVH